MTKVVFRAFALLGIILLSTASKQSMHPVMLKLTNGFNKHWTLRMIVINGTLYEEPRDGECVLNKEIYFTSNGQYAIDTTCNNQKIFCTPVPFSLYQDSNIVILQDTSRILHITDSTLLIRQKNELVVTDSNITVNSNIYYSFILFSTN
jgi:hypothetical protein